MKTDDLSIAHVGVGEGRSLRISEEVVTLGGNRGKGVICVCPRTKVRIPATKD